MESKADKPTSRLVLKLIRCVIEIVVGFFGVVAPVVNDNSDSSITIRCFNLDLYILIVMLETKLKRPTITDSISFKNWFMYRSYLVIF